jgi:metallo-beta-lactamase family protein
MGNLLITHCHIDHVGRIPHLLMAGFNQPIFCTEATAQLLPLVLEDAMKIGVTQSTTLIRPALSKISRLTQPTPYGKWITPFHTVSDPMLAGLQIRFQPASRFDWLGAGQWP